MKPECHQEVIFHLCDEHSTALFAFGKATEYDIWIGKKGIKAFCLQSQSSCYNYHNQPHALVGVSGIEKQFEIKRIVIIEFQ
jgi:hypothetical protein